MSSSIQPSIQLPGEPTWEVAYLFPVQGQWSEEDYLALDSNRLVELSDGYLEVLPMPTIPHQRIVAFLFGLLTSFVKSHADGEVFFAPLPVHLWTRKYREPDIVYVRPNRISGDRDYPEGADLVMEVVSEGDENRKRDLDKKPIDYAKAGISEYWIVDPEDRKITVLSLRGTAYHVHGKFKTGNRATSVLFPDFAVEVDAAFAAAKQRA